MLWEMVRNGRGKRIGNRRNTETMSPRRKRNPTRNASHQGPCRSAETSSVRRDIPIRSKPDSGPAGTCEPGRGGILYVGQTRLEAKGPDKE